MRFELTKESAERLAQEAVRRGASAAEVVMKRRKEFAVSVRLGEVEKVKESIDQGLGLRVLINGQQACVSCSDFSREGVLELFDEAIELARAASVDESAGLPEAGEFAQEIPDLDLYDEAVERLTTEEKIEMALAAEGAAQAYSERISNFDGGGLETASSTIVLANSLGFAGEYDGTMIGLATVPVAADDQGRMQRDYWYDTRRRLKDLAAPEEIGRIA